MDCKNAFGDELPEGVCNRINDKSNQTNNGSENFTQSIIILLVVVVTMIIVTIFSIAGYHAFLQHPELPLLYKIVRGATAAMLAPFYLSYTYIKIYIYGRD